MVCRTAGRGTHRPFACSRRAGGKRAFERLPRDRPKELTQILRSAGEHVPRRWVLGEPKPADGPVFWWANNGRKSSCSPASRRRPRWFCRAFPQWGMHTGRFVFSELIAHLPHQEFQKCVARYDDHPQPRKLSYWDQYLAMAFAQLTYRESLRDIEACLRSVTGKLYHLGFRGTVARSTLADANETRDWRIFAEFAHVLIKIARPLSADEPLGVDLDQSLYEPVCFGLDHHRPVPGTFSVGEIPEAQGRREDAHPAGPARQYPHLYSHFRRKTARRERPRRHRHGG